MKTISILILLTLISSCSLIRTPYKMTVTDWSGNVHSKYIAGQALNLHIGWDSEVDVGKQVNCSFSNAFSGELKWSGEFIIPSPIPEQRITKTIWKPALPATGIKLSPGSYISVCNFNGESKLSVPLEVISDKPKKVL